MKRLSAYLLVTALFLNVLGLGLPVPSASASSALAWADGSGHVEGVSGYAEETDDVTISPSHVNLDALSGSISVHTVTRIIDHQPVPPGCVPNESHSEPGFDSWSWAKVVPGQSAYGGGQDEPLPASGTWTEVSKGCQGSFNDSTDELQFTVPASAFGNLGFGCYQTAGGNSGLYLGADNATGTVATLTVRDAAHPNYDCASKLDSDMDGVVDSSDNCPADKNKDQHDADGDGKGDVCDDYSDADQDGVPDDSDNCPSDWNHDQANLDKDSLGDVCDPDRDGDGISNDDEATNGTDPDKADTDDDGLKDGIEANTMTDPLIADTDGGGINDGPEYYRGSDPNDPLDDTCDGASHTTTRAWRAKTDIPFFFDRNWGDFKVTAVWCYDKADGFGIIKDIQSKGTIDGGPLGLFDAAAGLFGFETRWEKQVCDPHCGSLTDVGVSSASVNRKMCFCFNLTTLVDKLGIKGYVIDKAGPALRTRLKKYIERHNGLKGPGLPSNFLAWADDLILKARDKIDNIDVMLRDKHVPRSIADWLEDQIEDPLDRLMEAWKSDVAEQLYKGEYADLTAERATDKIIGDLFDKVFNLARICDSGAFLFGDDFPGFLTLWKPVVTAYVTQDGEIKFSRNDEYKHPALKIVKL